MRVEREYIVTFQILVSTVLLYFREKEKRKQVIG